MSHVFDCFIWYREKTVEKKKQNIKKEKIETEPKKNVEKKYQDDNVEDIKSGHTNKNIYVYSECESSLHEMSVLWTICSPQSIHMYVDIWLPTAIK